MNQSIYEVIMNTPFQKFRYLSKTSYVLLAQLLFVNVLAHEPASYTDSGVSRMNDTVYTNVLQAQTVLSSFMQRIQVSSVWPDPQITRLHDDLIHLKEETEHSLEYFGIIGVNIRSAETLRENPIAGRSVAAAQAVETTMTLLKHVMSLDSQDSFVSEIYSGGTSAYMYNLVGAHREKMELYAEIEKLKTR